MSRKTAAWLVALGLLGASGGACALEPLAMPVDPLGTLELVGIDGPGRSFVLLPGSTGLRAAVARDLANDVLVVDLTKPDTSPIAVGVGLGPRSIALCSRAGGSILVTADTTGSSLTVLREEGASFALAST